MKIDLHIIIGSGILLAAVTGIGSMVFGYPFLTSTFGHFHLPWVGEIELASAMAFDMGVFLAVVGSIMLALTNLSHLGRRLSHSRVHRHPKDKED